MDESKIHASPSVDDFINFAQQGRDPKWVLAYAATAIAMMLREQNKYQYNALWGS